MQVVVQRVLQASVTIDKQIYSSINQGLLLLVGFTHHDSPKEIDYLVNKILHLRIFDDDKGVMNKSIQEIKGSILSVSQFTLYANTLKGRRPSYEEALEASQAKKLYEIFNEKLNASGIKLKTGVFQKDMQVSLINDGPITILLKKEGQK